MVVGTIISLTLSDGHGPWTWTRSDMIFHDIPRLALFIFFLLCYVYICV